jgi:hypothetical protein
MMPGHPTETAGPTALAVTQSKAQSESSASVATIFKSRQLRSSENPREIPDEN